MNAKYMGWWYCSIMTAGLWLVSGVTTQAGNWGTNVMTVIPSTDTKLRSGFSPYNWVFRNDHINSSVNGASLSIGFKDTRQVALRVDVTHMTKLAAGRYPIIAWSVNGCALQTHQLVANDKSVLLTSGVANPVIHLFIKGMSPFEDRWAGDVPVNSVKISGFEVDEGGSANAVVISGKVWLNIGDSIMSGDGAAYARGQGRPPNDFWAASDDGRASYGYLLAQHYGFREARIAFGGYNWSGGMAGVPALPTLIDQRTSTDSRLSDGVLNPTPDVVLINLGENGVPADKAVIDALSKLRSRVKTSTKIIVMIPLSGNGQGVITRAFTSYKKSTHDKYAYLVDLGKIAFEVADGQHPTAAGHQAVYKAALPAFDAIFNLRESPTTIVDR